MGMNVCEEPRVSSGRFVDFNSVQYLMQTRDDYFESLNEYDIAASIINKDGRLVSSEVRGVYIELKPDKYGIILGTEFNPIVYRGLNNDYVFMPDSQRYELFDGKERIRHSINWIKKREFLNLMSETPYFTRIRDYKVSGCSYEFDMEAVAKHFNYMSDYVDVTRNMSVAYFFAYTYFNEDKKCYMPIENFEYNTPTIYVASLKDLYRQAPESVENLSWQPFNRTKQQLAMSVNTSKNWRKVQDVFKKVYLSKNPAIAKYIYELFEGGDLLFPKDYISMCATQVMEYKTLHEDLIYKYCDETKTDIKWLSEELKKLDYEFVNQPWYIPEQAKDIINKEIDENIIPYMSFIKGQAES